MRDWATSGLETGMALGWLGACFATVCARAVAPADRPFPAWRRWSAPVLLGLGVLIRPDFVFFTLAFGVAWLVLSAPGWRGRSASVLAALALPVGYELFRMGYYASLVPNTALAKEGSAARWGQGWTYLLDTVRPYALVIPLAAVLVGVTLSGVARRGSRQTLAVAAPLAGAALSTLWVVRVGGDYMHARFLVPAVFAAFLPLSVVDVAALRRRRPVELAIPAVVVVWAVVSLVLVPTRGQVPGADDFDRAHWIVNERLLYEGWNGTSRADLDRYYRARDIAYQLDEPMAAQAAGQDVFFLIAGFRYQQVPLPAGQGVRVDSFAAGRQGYAYGPGIALFDRFGLTDPVASRLELAQPRDRRPGHEKLTPDDWVWALNAPEGGGGGADEARHALSLLGPGRARDGGLPAAELGAVLRQPHRRPPPHLRPGATRSGRGRGPLLPRCRRGAPPGVSEAGDAHEPGPKPGLVMDLGRWRAQPAASPVVGRSMTWASGASPISASSPAPATRSERPASHSARSCSSSADE